MPGVDTSHVLCVPGIIGPCIGPLGTWSVRVSNGQVDLCPNWVGAFVPAELNPT